MSAGLRTVLLECRMNFNASWTTSCMRYSTSIASCFAASAERDWIPRESATSFIVSEGKSGLAMSLHVTFVQLLMGEGN
jgi:hypothetical protein